MPQVPWSTVRQTRGSEFLLPGAPPTGSRSISDGVIQLLLGCIRGARNEQSGPRGAHNVNIGCSKAVLRKLSRPCLGWAQNGPATAPERTSSTDRDRTSSEEIVL